ncbi:hypothetical protein BDV27DRAFT_128324 [Aspergillus caelatus]|uniref:Uncharacterized protein n=1 Tax=Aspergillus caelatus TaxID=61420 RepID=A0A5N7A4C7_9EURO|nr:uncharacterized protein BDV27DRAFT_128324 [Aspergillus caelatus]KAE8364545.1 hypothetical protein BDV27DRAFT_128324 [Aspergillus caelatus]
MISVPGVSVAISPPGWSDSNPYLSPLGSEYRLGVPLFIEAGTSEVLYDDIVQFALNMKEKGTEVELHEAPHGVHATFGIADALGMPEIAIDGHARRARFIARTGAE